MDEWIDEVSAAEFVGISPKKLAQHRTSLKYSHLVAEWRKMPNAGNKLRWHYKLEGLKTHKKVLAWEMRKESKRKSKPKTPATRPSSEQILEENRARLQTLIDSKPEPIVLESNAPKEWKWSTDNR